MSEKKEEETPEPKAHRIDRRALERGVRKALAIKPRDQGRREKQEGGSQKESSHRDKKEEKAP